MLHVENQEKVSVCLKNRIITRKIEPIKKSIFAVSHGLRHQTQPMAFSSPQLQRRDALGQLFSDVWRAIR